MMTTQTETNAKTPTHTIFVVEAKEANKSDWFKVGVAWEHSDKDGMSLSINSLGASYLTSKGQGTVLSVRRNKAQDYKAQD